MVIATDAIPSCWGYGLSLSFWSFIYLVVALHLDNSTAKAYLCNQGATVSLVLSRLACHISNLAAKYTLTPPFQHTYQPILMWKLIIFHDGLWFQNEIFVILLFIWCFNSGPEMALLASSWSNQCQHYYTLKISLPLDALRLITFNHFGSFG